MRTLTTIRISALVLVIILTLTAPGLTAEKITVDGSTGVMPLVAALARAYQHRHPAATVEMGTGLGTGARLQALIEGKIDIALASHGLDLEEITRRGLAAQKIAKVVVVFGVNADVPVTGLSDRQVCDIFAGRVTNWKELGGPDQVIIPCTRPETEVDTEVVRREVACFKGLRMAGSVRVLPKTSDMAEALSATAGAVGMTTLTVVGQSGDKIKALSLNGVAPSVRSVRSNAYALTRDSFLVMRAPPSPAVNNFLKFIRSPTGESVIVANGAIPVK